jgi:hypothetical protein
VLHKTLFHELTGEDPRTQPNKRSPLTPDTVNYFLLENGHAMEYYRVDDERMVALFFGPWELVLPSYIEYSGFKVFDGDMVGIFKHGDMIRCLRHDPILVDLYRESVKNYRRKVAERLYVARNFTPWERYMHLQGTQPWVFELAAKADVANYLGVSVRMLRKFVSAGGSAPPLRADKYLPGFFS